MAVMVFKRAAFESRKKPKGFLRPKTRANLKDAQFVSVPFLSAVDSIKYWVFQSIKTHWCAYNYVGHAVPTILAVFKGIEAV